MGYQHLQSRGTIQKKGKSQVKSKDVTVKDEQKEHGKSSQNYQKNHKTTTDVKGAFSDGHHQKYCTLFVSDLPGLKP